MDAQIILADYAQAAGGKLNLIGGGWQWCKTRMPQMAIAIIVETPYTETNQRQELTLELVNADGQVYTLPDGNPLRVHMQLEVGRPPGMPAGMAQRSVFAINATDLTFEQGTYEVRLTADGLHESVSFGVREVDQ